MSNAFHLHEKLAADTEKVAELPLCRCLLMRDARYPWLILVPRIEGLRELHEVPEPERAQLFVEIEQASLALQQVTNPYKLNVAALGNQVPQLHIHVIARRTDDPAWPGPVWGVGASQDYDKATMQALLRALRAKLNSSDSA